MHFISSLYYKEVTHFFGVVGFAHILSFFVLSYHVFLCSEFRLWGTLRFPHKTMFGSSLFPVVYRKQQVLFTLVLFVCAQWCATHIVFQSCVTYVFRWKLLQFIIPTQLKKQLLKLKIMENSLCNLCHTEEVLVNTLFFSKRFGGK